MNSDPKLAALAKTLEEKMLLWRSSQEAALPAIFAKELSIYLVPTVTEFAKSNGATLEV